MSDLRERSVVEAGGVQIQLHEGDSDLKPRGELLLQGLAIIGFPAVLLCKYNSTRYRGHTVQYGRDIVLYFVLSVRCRILRSSTGQFEVLKGLKIVGFLAM